MASKDTKSSGLKKAGGDKSDLKWSVDGKPVKVDKWDGAALKNSLDDAVKKLMTEKFSYAESHSLMDSKLLICTIAVGFAGFALLWDYLNPFPASKPVLIVCVLSYFLMMGVLTLFTMYKELGIFFICVEKDKAGIDPDNVWTISSYIKRYDDMYNLTFTYVNGETKKTREVTVEKSVASFFDVNGVFCHDLFEPEVTKMHDSLTSTKKDK